VNFGTAARNLRSTTPVEGAVLNPNLQWREAEDDELKLTAADEKMLSEAKRAYEVVATSQDLETLHETFEQNAEKSKKEKWQGQERWQGRENEEARLVNMLTPDGFIRKLRAAGIDARNAPSKYARIWLAEGQRMGRVAVSAWVTSEDTGQQEERTITTLQDGVGPEWSIMRFNRYDVPTSEKYRGWRTALLHLIIANVLSEDEVERAFGAVTLAPHSEFYREQLQNNRARRLGMQV
jgi:hypothetical protein